MRRPARALARPRYLRRPVRPIRRLRPAIGIGVATGLTALLPLVLPAPPAGALAAGSVITVGQAGFHGSALDRPVTGIAPTPSGNGYWLAGDDGGVFGFGDATFHGSMGGARLSSPIVDIVASRSGGGYWLVGADGAVFGFGDASFAGSTGDQSLNQPIVGMAATPTGAGYWLVAADGGIFTFGDALFHGSAGALQLKEPIVGMAATSTGAGYWLVAADGGIFTFGDATFHGAVVNLPSQEHIVGMASTATGGGYWLAGAGGALFSFGDAAAREPSVDAGASPLVGIAATPGASGNWVVTGGRPMGSFDVTCYSLRGSTKSGAAVSEEAVAVDPRVIPLGTRIFIEGIGTRVAADTGANIKGRRLDIWHPSSSYCREFGRKTLSVHRPT